MHRVVFMKRTKNKKPQHLQLWGHGVPKGALSCMESLLESCCFRLPAHVYCLLQVLRHSQKGLMIGAADRDTLSKGLASTSASIEQMLTSNNSVVMLMRWIRFGSRDVASADIYNEPAYCWEVVHLILRKCDGLLPVLYHWIPSKLWLVIIPNYLFEWQTWDAAWDVSEEKMAAHQVLERTLVHMGNYLWA